MEIEKITERFNEIAEKYDSQRRLLIPCFDDFYGTSISFLAGYRRKFRSILDLGAGTGLLTSFLYKYYPGAQYTLVDVSDQMLDVARERFKGLNNFQYITGDYAKDLPAYDFDLIASALSIHHLDSEGKASLYSGIYQSLGHNGCFINLDQFNAASDTMNKCYNNWWGRFIDSGSFTPGEREAMLKRRELDRENTVDETKDLLKQAGFSTVECIYSFMKFGVVLAVK